MKLNFRNTVPLLMAALISLPAEAGSGLRIEHIGDGNTIVRIDSDARYLMLPVQEAYDDASVQVLVDGKLDKTINVRLAKSAVDYSVPFDLTPYRGHELMLNVRLPHDRRIARDTVPDICWETLVLADSASVANTEKYRPAFHHTPLYGWMNDPNGMFFKDGVWHLYYQWNPYGSKWQNLSWGHSTSTDLVNWSHHPAALEPDALGLIFSGSSAIDKENSAGFGENAIIAMYTSAGARQVQSLAHSEDGGQTFIPYPGNPVIALPTEARDPNMSWDPQTKLWTLILAHALDHEMLIFTSPDLKEWTLQSSFGQGLGAQNGVWECPDLFELPVKGTDMKKWVLICNINPGGPFGGSGVQYFTGDFDGKTFTVDTDASGSVPTKWLDYGKDNYALVSWSDAPQGRRTAIGWMSNWQYAADVPTKQFRSANTLPREIELFKAADGEIYAASVPSPELLALRGRKVTAESAVAVSSKGRSFVLPDVCEIELDIMPASASAVTLTLSNSAGEKVVMTYAPALRRLSFDRRESGATSFSKDFPAVTTAPTFSESRNLPVRIFVDRSSIEIFTADGRSVMTNLVFPTEPYSTLTISSEGGNARVRDLSIYEINSVK